MEWFLRKCLGSFALIISLYKPLGILPIVVSMLLFALPVLELQNDRFTHGLSFSAATRCPLHPLEIPWPTVRISSLFLPLHLVFSVSKHGLNKLADGES